MVPVVMTDAKTEKQTSQVRTALKSLRVRAGLTIRGIADQAGMKFSTYNSYERTFAKEYLPVSLVKRLLPVLVGRGSPPISEQDVLVLGDASMPSGRNLITAQSGVGNVRETLAPPPLLPARVAARDVPIFGAVAATQGFTMHLTTSPIEYAPRPPGLESVQTAFAFYAVDDSMAPWRQVGELVYVHQSRPAQEGCHVIVRLKSGTWLLRRLVERSGGELTLEKYRPNERETVAVGEMGEMLRVLEWPEVLGLG
jgi:SOS-response transcriptional repressor LexA